MKTSAIPSPTCAAKTGLITLALAVAFTAAPAMAQNQPRGLNDDANVRDVAMTPLTDLNLANDPIPELLLAARANPYDDAGLRNCRDVRRLVGELDTVLGTDYDMEAPADRAVSPGNIAQRILGSFIPFRGIIREVSGANEHERDFREAIAAGMMRRAYIKGRGQGLGCAYPARPATMAQAAAWRAERDAHAAQQEGGEDDDDDRRDRQARAPARRSDDGTEFVSEPVVQPID
jgi:hypothetical protein